MPGYQHVLFATDLTDAALRAGRRAVEQAGPGGRLTLLHVVEHFPEDLSVGSPPVDSEDPEGFVRRRAAARLAELAERLGAPQAEQHVIVSRYSARQAILDFAREAKVDLLVMGVIGHPGQLGSTVNGVAAYAPCDVLIIQGAGWGVD